MTVNAEQFYKRINNLAATVSEQDKEKNAAFYKSLSEASAEARKQKAELNRLLLKDIDNQHNEKRAEMEQKIKEETKKAEQAIRDKYRQEYGSSVSEVDTDKAYKELLGSVKKSIEEL